MDRVKLLVDKDVPATPIGQTEREFSSKPYDACYAWLSTAAHRIRRIQLKSEQQLTWQLLQFLSLLCSSSLQRQPELEVRLLAGSFA